MRSQGSTKRQRKLRKQQMRRLESAASLSMPRLRVPPTARRRRRRNQRWRSLPTSALKHLVLTARWISLLLLAASVGALALIGMDESFYLTMIPVEGVASIPPAEVVSASGLAGAHVFAAEPRAAARKIADLPGVISATVTLEWPNRAHVRIREQSPVAVWEQDGETYWVNEGGELLPARVDATGLLHIKAEDSVATGAALPAPAVEESETPAEDAVAQTKRPILFVPEDVLEGALRLRKLLPAADALYYDASGGLSYEDERGWRAYFGTGTDMAQKLVVYDAIVAHLEGEGVTPTYVSVSNKETPYYLAR